MQDRVVEDNNVGWKEMCLKRFPDTKYIERQELFKENYYFKSYKHLFYDLEKRESAFLKKKITQKMIMNVTDPKKRDQKTYTYPVGVSSRYAVVVNSYDEKRGSNVIKVGTINFIAVNEEVVTVQDDPQRKDRHNPLWQTDNLVLVSGDIKLARIYDDCLLLITDKIVYENNNFVTKQWLYYYKISPNKLRCILDRHLQTLPSAIIAKDDAIFMAVDSKDNSGGLYCMHKSDNWKNIVKLHSDSIKTLELVSEPIQDSQYKYLLLCGLSDNLGSVIGVDMSDLSINAINSVMNNSKSMWKRSFWTGNNTQKYFTPELIKFVANTENLDFQMMVFSKDTGLFMRNSNDSSIPKVNHIIPEIGTVIGAATTNNIVVLHHSTNDILIMHHTSGNKVFYRISLEKKYKAIHDTKANFIYNSVQALFDRFIIMLPDGNIIFLLK